MPDDDHQRPALPDGISVGGALIMALDMPDPEPVATPLFSKGKLGTFTGHPGHCKSTFMNGLLVRYGVARAYGPIEPKADGILYFVSAEDLHGTRDRMLGEAAKLRLTEDERIMLNVRLRWMHVESNVSARAIADAIRIESGELPVALIFIDTGPALFNGDDENDNVALRNYVESFNVLTQIDGMPAVVLAWHPSKGAGADRLQPRGASAISAVIDFNLTIWRDDDRVTVSYTKMRGAHFDPIEGRIAPVELIGASGEVRSAPSIDLDAVDKPGRSDAREAREALLRRLYTDRHEPPTVRALATALGKAPSTVHGHLERLAQARPPLVSKDPVTDKYSLTKAGESRAKEILCPT